MTREAMETGRLPALAELDDYELVDDDQDIRGCRVRDRAGHTLGTVERMLADPAAERIAALVLSDGRVIAIEEVEIGSDGEVVIDTARDLPREAVPARRGAAAAPETTRIPVVEERIAIGKRAVERGRIHVRARVVEKPVSEQVRLREEHVAVERRPVDKRLNPDEADRAFQDRDIEVAERREEAVVGKEARVVEEVVVARNAQERVETVRDTVRRTEVDVDRDAAQRGKTPSR